MKAIERRSGSPSWIASSRRSAIPPSRPGTRTRVRFEPPSPEAIRSGFWRASSARSGPSELREVSTRCHSAPQAARQRLGEARRALLQQGDVPGGAGEQRRELGREVAVDLDVGLVALVEPQQPRAPAAQLRVGREVAPVEEVPGDRCELHGRSIRGLTARLPHRRRARRLRARQAARPGGGAESRPRRAARRRLAGRAQRRARLREALDADADLLRGRRRRARRDADRPARRRDAALPRRVDRRHRAGALALRRRDRRSAPAPTRRSPSWPPPPTSRSSTG